MKERMIKRGVAFGAANDTPPRPQRTTSPSISPRKCPRPSTPPPPAQVTTNCRPLWTISSTTRLKKNQSNLTKLEFFFVHCGLLVKPLGKNAIQLDQTRIFLTKFGSFSSLLHIEFNQSVKKINPSGPNWVFFNEMWQLWTINWTTEWNMNLIGK